MTRTNNKRKWIVGVIVLIALIIVGVVIGIILNQNEGDDYDENDGNNSTEMIDEKESGRKDDETEEEYSTRLAEEKRIKQYEGGDPNKAEELSGAITYTGVNDGILVIGMNIDQFLSDGNCELNLMRDGDLVYSTNARILAEVSTSTCDGFNIPIDGLGNGMTKVIIKLTSNGKNGEINGEVNI